MSTQKIPREEWVKFFDDFSKKHLGWITSVKLMGPQIGDQEEASGLPLVGISADLKDSEHRIEIGVGGRPDSDFTHIINSPKAVELRPAVGGLEALEVTSSDGTITLVTFSYVPAEQTERELPE
jgi:hypothetical protein